MTERKKTFQITIAGKDYTIAGIDDSMKIRRITDVLNNKVKQLGGLRKYNPDTKNAMMQINLAEDVVDLTQVNEDQQMRIERLEQEIYELKQELINVRMESHKAIADAALMKQENAELRLQIAESKHNNIRK